MLTPKQITERILLVIVALIGVIVIFTILVTQAPTMHNLSQQAVPNDTSGPSVASQIGVYSMLDIVYALLPFTLLAGLVVFALYAYYHFVYKKK